MSSSDCIEQKGVIKNIKNGVARVAFTSYSSCANCESKISCGITESVTKEIDVQINQGDFNKGEIVAIEMKRSLGLKAVALAYLIPFILVLTTLAIFNSIGFKEIFTGIISLSVLVPYFILLYFLRHKLNRTFSFSLKKI